VSDEKPLAIGTVDDALARFKEHLFKVMLWRFFVTQRVDATDVLKQETEKWVGKECEKLEELLRKSPNSPQDFENQHAVIIEEAVEIIMKEYGPIAQDAALQQVIDR
jgi:hypothetical protein